MSSAPILPAYSMNREDFPRMYERALVEPLFLPWAEDLLARATLAPRARVLDIACGTGIVARLAQRRLSGNGIVVGVDISAPMLTVARAIEPRVDWRQGDAIALPVEDGETFDVVTCQQGLQFFGDRATAGREMRRVLAQRGTALVAVWRSIEEMPLLRDLKSIAERHVGPIADQRHAFPDGAALERLLHDVGFHDVTVESRCLTMRFADGAEFVRMNSMALLGMSGVEVDQTERERLLETIASEGRAAAGSHMEGATLAFDMTANVARAH